MAINKNHEFEELDGIKAAIVERNISKARAMFLKEMLVNNGYTVVIVPTPPPKITAKKDPKAEEASETEKEEIITPPELFVLGVTDLSFNPTNAIFGRLLKLPNGKIVTQAYWNEEEDETGIPYYEHTQLKKK